MIKTVHWEEVVTTAVIFVHTILSCLSLMASISRLKVAEFVACFEYRKVPIYMIKTVHWEEARAHKNGQLE